MITEDSEGISDRKDEMSNVLGKGIQHNRLKWNFKGDQKVRQPPQLMQAKGFGPDFITEVIIGKIKGNNIIPKDNEGLLFQW